MTSMRRFQLLALISLLTPAPARAAFPGENGLIYISCPGSLTSICSFNLETKEVKEAVKDVDRLTSVLSFSVSPDGQKLLAKKGGKWIIVDLTSGQEAETKFPTEINAQPVWSPDCKNVAVIRSATGDVSSNAVFNVYTFNQEGEAQQRTFFSTPRPRPARPAWSPDGSRIAFQLGDPAFLKIGIAVVDLSSGQVRDVTNEVDAFHLAPTWSPDSSQIVFSRQSFGQNSPNQAYFRVSASGGSPVRLSSDHDGRLLQASFSPDGAAIVLPHPEGLFKVPAQGGQVVKILDLPVPNSQLDHFSFAEWAPVPNNSCGGCLIALNDLSPPLIVDRPQKDAQGERLNYGGPGTPGSGEA